MKATESRGVSASRGEDMLTSKRRAFMLKLMVSATLLGVLLFYSIDFQLFQSSLANIAPAWLLLSIMLFFPAQLLAAYRWHYLLRALGHPQPFNQVLHHSLLGQLSALFLPGQLSGDVVRTVAIARGREGKGTLVISVIVDKLAMLAAIALTALAGGLLAPKWRDQALLHGVSLLIVGGALAAIYLLAIDRSLLALLWGLATRLPISRVLRSRVGRMVAAAEDTEVVAYGPIAVTLALALFLMAISSLGSYSLLRAMSIPVGLWDWMVVGGLVSVIQLAPISVGGLGVREGATSVLLLSYGVQPGVATTFSLVGFVFSILLLWASWLVSGHYLQRERIGHDNHHL